MISTELGNKDTTRYWREIVVKSGVRILLYYEQANNTTIAIDSFLVEEASVSSHAMQSAQLKSRSTEIHFPLRILYRTEKEKGHQTTKPTSHGKAEKR